MINITKKKLLDLLRDYNVYEEKYSRTGELISQKIKYPNLGELIYSGLDLKFLTVKDNGQIYRYNGGYYEDDGETTIKAIVGKILEDGTSEHAKNEVIGYIRDKNYQNRDIFDPPINLINLQNGIYDLQTEKLLKNTSEHYFLNNIPIKYDKNADCPNIKQFFREVVYEEDIPVLQEIFGYCLYRKYTIHKAIMFLGDGRNGKSTVLNLLKHFLGFKNIANKELQAIIYNRFAISKLYGRLANISADISDKALERTGMFKSLTGADTVDAELKFKDSFSFVNYAKFLFSANKLPMSNDKSYAFFSRWILISFPYTFEGKDQDPHILDSLLYPEEMSGLLNWALEGLKRLLSTGEFSYGKSVDEVMEQYKTMSDPIYAYCAEFLKCSTGESVVKDDLWNHYVEWAKKNKLPVTPKNILTQKLGEHLPEIRTGKVGGKGNQKPAFMNINWKDDVKIDNNEQSMLITNSDTDLTGGIE